MGPRASVAVLALLLLPTALAQLPPENKTCIDAFEKLCPQCLKGSTAEKKLCGLKCATKNKDALLKAGCKPPAEYEAAFASFVDRFNKQYADEKEFDTRFANFKATFDFITRENAKATNSYELGVNRFSDLTPDEFAERHFGFVKPKPLR